MQEQHTDTTDRSAAKPAAAGMTRRRALQAGAGVAGLAVALATRIMPALAQDRGSTFLPYLGTGDVTATGTGEEPVLDASAWQQVQAALGNTPGKVESGNVLKIELPRSDITATIGDVAVRPEFALTTELTFQPAGENSVLMKGELLLLDAEVNPVISGLYNENLKPNEELIAALHNHYLLDNPPLRFMHIFAKGNAQDIATAVYRVLSTNTKTPFGQPLPPPGTPGLDAAQVASIIGGTSELKNGVLEVAVPRNDKFRQRGYQLKPAMQVSSMFHFQDISPAGQVAFNGEYIVRKNEVNAVASALRKRGFLIAAVHNHELDIAPDAYYVHAWRTGDPVTIATDVKAVLKLTDSKTA